MADKTFITLLTKLSKNKQLTMEITNFEIEQAFPKKEFLDSDEKNTNILIRKLIPYKLARLVHSNLEVVFKLINKVYPKLYENQTTLDNLFSTDVRKVISKRFGVNSPEHRKSKKLVALTYEDKGQILKDAKEKVVKKQQNRTEYSTDQIIKIIQDNVISEDPFRKATALACAAGTRPIELFTKSDFKLATLEPNNPSYKDRDHYVDQNGIAKKKGVETTIIKPILYLTAQQFIDNLKEMRTAINARYPKILTKNGQLNGSIGTQANKAAKTIFEHQGDFTFYTTRKLYGLLSYDLYGKKPNMYGANMSYASWLSKVLGHKEGDLTTSLNYSHFSIEPDKTVTPDEILAQQAVLQTKLEYLQERFDESPCVDELEADTLKNKVKNNPKMQEDFVKLKKYYKDFVSQTTYQPTQTMLEQFVKGIIPRSVVRIWYKLPR